jgi:hypothetical protein
LSTVLNVADAVVAQLNTASLSQPVVAERLYVPNFDLQDMQDLRVTVVPRELHVRGLDRGRNSYEAEIDLAVQKKFKKGDAAEIDPLVAFVEEIADLFRLKRLASFPGAIWSRTDHQVLYSQEHWDQLRQFTSLLTLTFRVMR